MSGQPTFRHVSTEIEIGLAGFQVHFVPHRHSSAPDVLPPPRRGPSVGYCVPAPDVGQLELEVLARAAGSR